MKKAIRFVALAISAVLTVPAIALSTEAVSVDAKTIPQAAMSLVEDDGASAVSDKADTTGKINTKDFDIQVEFGLEGNYRPNSAIPVSIDIESLNADFEGTVRIIVPADPYSDEDGIAYEKSIMLTQASPKVVTLSVYNDDAVNNIYFQLVNAKGKILIDKKIRINENSSDNALVGILSDDYTALNYFDQKKIDTNNYYGVTQLLELDADKMPEQASGIGILSYLIINSYDTQKLSQSQIEAIEGYVKDGGILIIGGGSDYQQTLSNFDQSFVPIKTDGYAQGLLEVGTDNYIDENYYDDDYDYLQDLQDWMKEVEESYIEHSHMFDDGLEDETSEDSVTEEAADESLEAATEDTSDVMTNPQDGMDPGVTDNGVVYEAHGNAVNFTDKDGILSMTLDGGRQLDGVVTQDGLVWIYNYGQGNVVVTSFNLGMEPVNSWADKDNMAACLLMAAAEGYSGERLSDVNYGNYTSTWSIRNTLSYIQQDTKPIHIILIGCMFLFIIACPISFAILKAVKKPMWIWIVIPANAAFATAMILLSTINLRIHAPQVSSYTVMLQDGSTDGAIGQENYMGILIPSTKMTDITFTDNVTSLKILQNDNYYYGDEKEENQKFSKVFRETSEGYQIGVENKNTFETEYVTFNSLPDSNNQGLDTEFVLTMSGLRGTIVNHTGYDLSHVLIYGYNIAVEVNDLPDGATFTFDEADNDITYSNYYISAPGANYDDPEYHKIDSLYEFAYDEYMNVDSSYMNSFYIIGYVEDYSADYVSTKNVKEVNEALFIKSMNVPYSDFEGARMVRLYDYAEYNSDWDSYDGQLYEYTVYADFDLYGAVSDIRALIAHPSEYSYQNDAEVYAYNYVTGNYDQLFVDEDSIEFDGACPYLSDGKEMSLKFECTSTYDSYAPMITVVGEE